MKVPISRVLCQWNYRRNFNFLHQNCNISISESFLLYEHYIFKILESFLSDLWTSATDRHPLAVFRASFRSCPFSSDNWSYQNAFLWIYPIFVMAQNGQFEQFYFFATRSMDWILLFCVELLFVLHLRWWIFIKLCVYASQGEVLTEAFSN